MPKLFVCRPGNGFEWYDTGQAHILTNITFRHCGVESSGDGALIGGAGCGDGTTGCDELSSVWLLLCHSDEHIPEFMQAGSPRPSTHAAVKVRCGLLVHANPSRSMRCVAGDGGYQL